MKQSKNTVICHVCNREFKRVTHTHLKHHGLTLDRYVELYPHAELVSEATRSSLATNSLSHFIQKHGPSTGREKYEQYRERMAYTNSFEYKQQKGWTREQYDEYNKSRASTKENFIKRWGETPGLLKWEEYCKHQQYAGVSLEYFKHKYGNEEGQIKYDEVCKSKSHNLDSYIKKYGSEKEALRKLDKFFSERRNIGFTSKIQKHFGKILIEHDVKGITEGMHSCLSGTEFGRWSHLLNKYVRYDFVFPELKKCVEFNGDYWHCNPKQYNSDYFHPHRQLTASEIWDFDAKKALTLQNDGYSIKEIWESDFNNDPEHIIEEVISWLKN